MAGLRSVPSNSICRSLRLQRTGLPHWPQRLGCYRPHYKQPTQPLLQHLKRLAFSVESRCKNCPKSDATEFCGLTPPNSVVLFNLLACSLIYWQLAMEKPRGCNRQQLDFFIQPCCFAKCGHSKFALAVKCLTILNSCKAVYASHRHFQTAGHLPGSCFGQLRGQARWAD